MNLSYVFLIVALILAAFAVWPMAAGVTWRDSRWPASWFFFLLHLVLAGGGVNMHG